MVHFTGDIHGSPMNTVLKAESIGLTTNDTLIMLGDVGANYFGDTRDDFVKASLARIPATILCLHGNHEQRPGTIDSYKTKEWNGGIVWYEEEYPNLLFAKDGEIYTIEGKNYIAIGGAYSVDKHYRLVMGYHWWADEQPSEETKRYVEQQIQQHKVDVVLSHTCPLKYTPVECFLPGIDQSTVDRSTEEWLDKIEEAVDYTAWYCGHWHTNKHIDKLTFLFHDWVLMA